MQLFEPITIAMFISQLVISCASLVFPDSSYQYFESISFELKNLLDNPTKKNVRKFTSKVNQSGVRCNTACSLSACPGGALQVKILPHSLGATRALRVCRVQNSWSSCPSCSPASGAMSCPVANRSFATLVTYPCKACHSWGTSIPAPHKHCAL